ncbi:MAG: KinB-signaling pathway activation protein [Candidatus Cohnella colombiensis]|uniref:KinB-signaling pathway activation protein n=1 Tax=Candidatus Cohnella colombiensis TaxID=3121368 RepID=A0AA95EUU0_9BACL|nr:MAG: KinB-signaling pathway activation protein [Cohnella sp.]
MNLRKWMKLFLMSIMIGALASAVTGIVMMLTDQEFQVTGTSGWLFNIAMMALIGLTFGAFSHMGFFAYLMLNYIARSIIKRPYIWLSLQAFVAVFALAEIGYWTFESEFPTYVYWAVPLVLLVVSTLVAWRKTSETSSGAWIPTLFFLIVVTTVESVPAFRTGSISSLIFQMVPLFVCNAYQIMQLHRILGNEAKAPIASNPKTSKASS